MDNTIVRLCWQVKYRRFAHLGVTDVHFEHFRGISRLHCARHHSTAEYARLESFIMDHSPLHKLPAELRQAIYEECLTFESVLTVRFSARSVQLMQGSFLISHPLGITNTCKEIRHESVDLVLKLNTIRLDISQYGLPDPRVGPWFKRLSNIQISLIRRCEIYEGEWETTCNMEDGYRNWETPESMAKEIARLFRSHTESLRRPSMEQIVVLQVHWNDVGLRHCGSELYSFEPIEVVLLLGADGDRTRAELRETVKRFSEALDQQVRKYTATRLVENLPQQKRKVEYNLQKARQCVLTLLGLLEDAVRMKLGVGTISQGMDVAKVRRELEVKDARAAERSSVGA